MSKTFTRALVTGASSGIGRAIATELAADGVALVAVARSTDQLEALADHVDVDVEVMAADLLEPTDLTRVADRLQADPPIDLLVNCAGFGSGGEFARLDLEDELRQAQIHVQVVMTLTHAALNAMTGRGGGILTVSSMSSYQPLPGSATYSACKAFETSFSESVRVENLSTGIHVTALCPGFVDTPMVQGDPVLKRLPQRTLLSPEFVAREGLAGVAANRGVVVPGMAWKAAAVLTNSMPRSASRFLAAGINRFR